MLLLSRANAPHEAPPTPQGLLLMVNDLCCREMIRSVCALLENLYVPSVVCLLLIEPKNKEFLGTLRDAIRPNLNFIACAHDVSVAITRILERESRGDVHFRIPCIERLVVFLRPWS